MSTGFEEDRLGHEPPSEPQRQPAQAPHLAEGPLRGTARNVDYRGEPYGQGQRQLLTFTVERFSADGNRLPRAAVEMRGLTIEGSVGEGDEVEVDGKWKNGTLHATGFRNLTTGASVRSKGVPGWLVKSVAAVFGLFVIAMIAAVVLGASFLGGAGPGGDGPGGGGGRVAVPDVVGQNVTEASARIADASLFPSSTFTASAEPLGRVVATEPAAGASVERNSTVILRVSEGGSP